MQKLVSTSTFMMFPGHEISTRYHPQPSSSTAGANDDKIMDGHSRRMSQQLTQAPAIPKSVSSTTSSPPLPHTCFRLKSGSVDSGTPESTGNIVGLGSPI